MIDSKNRGNSADCRSPLDIASPTVFGWTKLADLIMKVFVGLASLVGLLLNFSVEAEAAGPNIVYKGIFIGDTTIPGEQKKDWLQPSHPYCWQVSRDRWVWVFQTRGFSGIDAEHSILYQIRRDTPDGAVVKEGLLARFREDWDPLGDGSRYWKIHGAPKVFGVPKGAVDSDGDVLSNSNVFVAGWYTRARAVTDGRLLDPHEDEKLAGVQWIEHVHFQLNDAGDDIDLLTPATRLRQKGFEEGEQFCSLELGTQTMNHWARPPEPLDVNCTRWLDTPHFARNGIAAIEYRFNSKTKRYEWVRTGPMVRQETPGEGRFMEATINHVRDEWILCVRPRGHKFSEKSWGSCSAWFRTADRFAGFGSVTYAPTPSSYCPRTSYLMADGVLRIFSGDSAISPHRMKRNPLFCWDVNPEDFSVSNIRTILDAKKALGIRQPMVGFAKLSPVHGNRQILTFRVTTQNHRHATERFPEPVTEEELAVCGAHYCEVIYEGDVGEMWQFGE